LLTFKVKFRFKLLQRRTLPQLRPAQIFAGYDDELMRAVLAEPTMTTENWRLKYASTSITTDVRQRHSIREMYAASQPIADRKVDLSASQDAAVNDDVDYKKFVANEKKMAAKAAVAKEKSPPSAKKENKKLGLAEYEQHNRPCKFEDV